ncbi:MAG: N-acetyltransferase [Proteobacteria bacterium]|nr:N-acetyltransferase [Pseudomonadota bacterium]
MSEPNPVEDNAAASRFELWVEGRLCRIDYRRDGDVLALNHVEVPPSLEGRGIGSRLVSGALAIVRARGERVIPRCPFAARYLERHPEDRDLLAAPR